MMLGEMKAQEKNWEIVGLPGGKQTIGCKWAMQRYKTQLVAKVLYNPIGWIILKPSHLLLS